MAQEAAKDGLEYSTSSMILKIKHTVLVTDLILSAFRSLMMLKVNIYAMKVEIVWTCYHPHNCTILAKENALHTAHKAYQSHKKVNFCIFI